MVRIKADVFGEVEIDGEIFYSDMVIWWDGKKDFREKEHTINYNEFLKLMQRKPEIIVVGVGHSGGIKILPEVEQGAEDRGVEIFTEVSPKAAEMFNAFVADKKKVVAIIHTTC